MKVRLFLFCDFTAKRAKNAKFKDFLNALGGLCGEKKVLTTWIKNMSDDLPLLLQGLILGLSIAAPVGPIGVLCIRRTLSSERTMHAPMGMPEASPLAAVMSESVYTDGECCIILACR